MRLLLFGGSFNPIHWGHLILAEEVREEFGYDRVVFVPAARPPHKVGRVGSPQGGAATLEDPGPETRLALVRLACEGNSAFVVDDVELRRPGPSYTIDTVRTLGRRHSFEGLPGLVVGDDLAEGFPRWREPEALAAETDLILARRLGTDPAFPFRHRRASNLLIPLSSSDVRARLAAGRSLRYLVPEGVRLAIEEGRLYARP